MKTLIGIAKGMLRLLKYGAILVASVLRQRLARRQARTAPAESRTAAPLPA
jgi:hypothetical protein